MSGLVKRISSRTIFQHLHRTQSSSSSSSSSRRSISSISSSSSSSSSSVPSLSSMEQILEQGQRSGFGSFHSEDVEALIRQTNAEYRPPAIYSQIADATHTQTKTLHYGRDAKTALFGLDPSWDFLNHGAFGAVLEPLLRESAAWRVYCEKQPLR